MWYMPPFFCSLAELRLFVRLRLVLFFSIGSLVSPDRQEWETGEYFDSFLVMTGVIVIDCCCLFYFRLGQLVIPTFTGVGFR